MTCSATSAEAKPHTDTSHPTGGSLRTRRVLGLVAALITLIVVIAASLAIGARDMPLSEVLGAFFAPNGSDDQLVVLELRLPRTVLGILVGMGLGLAGGQIGRAHV